MLDDESVTLVTEVMAITSTREGLSRSRGRGLVVDDLLSASVAEVTTASLAREGLSRRRDEGLAGTSLELMVDMSPPLVDEVAVVSSAREGLSRRGGELAAGTSLELGVDNPSPPLVAAAGVELLITVALMLSAARSSSVCRVERSGVLAVFGRAREALTSAAVEKRLLIVLIISIQRQITHGMSPAGTYGMD